MKKKYQAPEVQTVTIAVEQGFAASAAIEDPNEIGESGDYWS